MRKEVGGGTLGGLEVRDGLGGEDVGEAPADLNDHRLLLDDIFHYYIDLEKTYQINNINWDREEQKR